MLGFRLQGFHLLRPGFRSRSPILVLAMSWSFNPGPSTGLGFSPFARRYSGNHCCFLFLRLLRCFSSPGTSLAGHVFTCRWQLMSAAGFPHSDTSASSLPYSFTELFAVWRVLLQFRVARHSPYALPYLISGSRVFRDVLFQELFFTVFSVYLTTYVLDLFCYVFSS